MRLEHQIHQTHCVVDMYVDEQHCTSLCDVLAAISDIMMSRDKESEQSVKELMDHMYNARNKSSEIFDSAL